MADPEILRYLAAKSGLGLNYLSKDEKISMLLEQIRDLFPEVVLKGGTALNRVYLTKLGVGRFSEDLDLDYVSAGSLDQKISAIKAQVHKIKEFDVKKARILHRTLRFDCHYINEFGQKDRVMLEFYLTKTKAVKIEDILVKSPFVETHPVIFKVYSLEDLMARKFVVLYNRTEGKDIYDMFYCLDMKFDKKNLFKALKFMLDFYRLDHDNFFGSLSTKLKDVRKNSYYIGNSTNHFLPRELRPNWKIFIDTLILKIESFEGD
jgi:predicted nucleotidyltransferase component of viral defense system